LDSLDLIHILDVLIQSYILADVMERDGFLEQEKKKFETMELELNKQIATIKTTYSELERELRTQADDLSTQIDETHKKLADAQVVARESESIKKRIDEIQAAFHNAQDGLQTERTRHEEIEIGFRVELAKLGGKLRASESNLKTKRSHIQDLEKQLDVATMKSSQVGEEKQVEIKSLRMQLEEAERRLENERSAHLEFKLEKEKTAKRRLETSVGDLRAKNDQNAAAAVHVEGRVTPGAVWKHQPLHQQRPRQQW
jgi:chromosome segregation ATPase